MVILIDHLKHEILIYIINNVDDSLDPRPLLGWVWQVLVNFGLSFVKYDRRMLSPILHPAPKARGTQSPRVKAPKLKIEGQGVG